MKFVKNISVFLSAGLLLAGACKKYEQIPVEFITEGYAYDTLDKNGVYAEQIVNNIYSYLNVGFNRINSVVLDAATDDAIASAYGNNIEILSKGRLSAGLLVDDFWADGYACIRKVNNFLSKIDAVPRAATDKKYWKAEVRFMRAYSYFELIKRYGGVPLIGDKVYQLEENIHVSRSSFADCMDYIVKECDAIKDSLRNESVASEFPDTFWGRITRSVAMSLKARALLYAASPLNNPGNDIQKWQLAANAAKAVMDLNYHALQASFTSTFLTRKNREIILARQRGLTNDLEALNAPVGFQSPNASNGFVSPSQNLVDAFPMANGRAIQDPASGYNASSPYTGRDPRLNWTVFYNGSRWLNTTVETFEGGTHKPGSIVQTRTGYYMRKFLADFSNASGFTTQTHNFPIFRYAGILLDYAEAINETGNQALAFAQLKAIRQRAGIPVGSTAGYENGLKTTMNQAEMREAIRLERRLEMAFEEQRYWDIRRWKIAETVAGGDVYGVRITKNADGSFSYTRFAADKLNFNAGKNYLYPIPIREIVSNGALNQNPGY